ncbi:unnamed protein product [Leuciscus chuanchicus]
METLPFGSQCGPSYPKRGLEGRGPLPPFVTSGGPMFFNSMGLHVMDAAGRSPTSYSNLQSQDTPAGVISESHCRSSTAVRCTPVKFPQAHFVPGTLFQTQLPLELHS